MITAINRILTKFGRLANPVNIPELIVIIRATPRISAGMDALLRIV
jgi:hypothetical protein